MITKEIIEIRIEKSKNNETISEAELEIEMEEWFSETPEE